MEMQNKILCLEINSACTVYPKKYAHGFVVLCFVVVMQSFIMNSHEVFIHIHQGCFAGTGAIVRLPQCQWSKPDGYGKTSQCITTTKHSKAKTVCIFLGIYCNGTEQWTLCYFFFFFFWGGDIKWHQAITWTNVDLSSVRSCAINPRALSLKDWKTPINKTTLEFNC